MFFITTIDSKHDDIRCVGYYKDFDTAKDVVINNNCDINETCYDFCIIENVPEGLYRYDYNPVWFRWNSETEHYEVIDYVPEQYKGEIGFSVG